MIKLNVIVSEINIPFRHFWSDSAHLKSLMFRQLEAFIKFSIRFYQLILLQLPKDVRTEMFFTVKKNLILSNHILIQIKKSWRVT